MRNAPLRVGSLTMFVLASLGGCSANGGGSTFGGHGHGGEAGGGGSPGIPLPPPLPGGDGTAGSSGAAGGGDLGIDGGTSGGSTGGGGTGSLADPHTCAEAAQAKSYVGCEFWPTVVANSVWSIFDFAVVVANAGNAPADVQVDRGGQQVASVTVAPNSLQKIFLPWVPELKGTDLDTCGSAAPLSSSVRANAGAYHLVSTNPVTVYQFNALEYRGAGGPAGKSWDACPGSQTCPAAGIPIGCFSFSNDASLLLPSSTLTGNYRVTTVHGGQNMASYFAITATADGTDVTVRVAPHGEVQEGNGVPATGANGVFTLSMNAGDVVEIVGARGESADLSGSLVQATKPVQVIGGVPCISVPSSSPSPQNQYTCDHLEESVFPEETWGKDYIVTVPTGPFGTPVTHAVRIFGNVDGTQLTYPGGAPQGAPSTIDAGQVVELMATQDFEVVGDHELAVASEMPSGELLDPGSTVGAQKGDPSFSLATAVEQYRTKYVFLAPDDYDVSYVDIVMPLDANVQIDAAPANGSPQPIGASGYGVARVKLGPGEKGSHVLVSDKPVGIQVMGYGSYTSYQYPGGLNLTKIAPPPPPIH